MRSIQALEVTGVALALSLFFGAALSQTTGAGFTSISFRVTETGAAEYRIPIRVPAGVAGIEPKLQLAYNSQGANGLLGIGSSLAGLSVIHRCGRTLVQDGVRGGINYDWNDRYCLDGQRLVAVMGSYGADGTEYRTERESFSKVISYGVAGNGPAWFKVWTKSGEILEYGNTADSRIEAQGKGSVLLYALNKISDTKGNYLTVSYSEDSVNGEFFATRIDYTGNTAAAQAPQASVRFVYATRPDPIYTNIGGAAVRISVRLTNVQTYVDTVMVTEYRLAYQQGAATGRSRLTSVTECRGDGTQCFAPVTFAWQDPAIGSQNWSWAGGHGNGSQGWRMADLFGDGRQVYYTKNADLLHHATRVNADGTLQNWDWSGHGIGDGGWDVADLFGDGRQVYWTHSSDGSHYATRLNADGTVQNWTWTGGHGIGSQGWQLGDLFGDGRQLYYTNNGDGWHHITRLNADGTLQNWSIPGGHGVGDQGWTLADIFGDGRRVYWTHNGNGQHFATRLNSNSTLENWTWAGGHGVGDRGWQVADLFGDGRQLYWTHNADGTHFATRLNPDGTLQNWTWTGGHGVAINQTCSGGLLAVLICQALNQQNWKLGDLFGDGRQVYYTRDQNGFHYATRLNPDGTLQNWTWSGGNGTADGGWQPADVFGDGRQLYYTHSSGGAHYATRFTTLKPDLLASVTNSLGVTTTFVHRPLTDGSVYFKANDAVYPNQDTQTPLYVVSSVTTANGIGGTATTNYFYTGAKQHLTSGGFLGFGQVRATDTQTGVYTVAVSRQDYPFQGLSLSVTRNQSSGALLSQISNTWSDTLYPNTTGKYHRSDLTQSVATGRDLGGTVLPTVTTTTAYDAYGNATSVTVSTADGYNKTTTNAYANDTVNWLLGRLSRSTVQSTTPP